MNDKRLNPNPPARRDAPQGTSHPYVPIPPFKGSATKPVHARPSLYAFYFEAIKEIGLKFGYNIVLHGSMNRDLDLIAIPWQEEIGNKVEMLNEIAETLGGNILNESEDARQLLRNKFHNRECWVININRTIKAKYGGMVTEFIEHTDPQYYIDISIIPIHESKDR